MAKKIEKKLSLLGAAYKVLKITNNKPRNPTELVELAEKKGLWSRGAGLTPAQSLSASLQIELKKRGKDSRFVRVGPGLWALANGKSPAKKGKAKKVKAAPGVQESAAAVV